jgi:ATP-dependent RNA helicase DDX3X
MLEEDLALRADMRVKNNALGEMMKDEPVDTEGEAIPEPVKQWQDAVDRKLLPKELMDQLIAEGMPGPTQIQQWCLPIIAQKRRPDVLASAQTGSGKTFAFVIPIVSNVVRQGPVMRPYFPGLQAQAGPLAVIMSPTRELCIQTGKEIMGLTKAAIKMKIQILCIYGGESMKQQLAPVEKQQYDIICATPGRLVDAVDGGKLTLMFCQTIVLDEADKMCDQGMDQHVECAMSQRDLPPIGSRQTCLFSATFPAKVNDFINQLLRPTGKECIRIKIGKFVDDKGGSHAGIKQIIKKLPSDDAKFGVIHDDLKELWANNGKVIIFSNRIKQAVALGNMLHEKGLPMVVLYGKQEQDVRERAVRDFSNGTVTVLIATNVAARGLDFPDVTLVVQLDLPEDIDSYTHRIGRTGRAGNSGVALGYYLPTDYNMAQPLIDFLQLNSQEVPEWLHQEARDCERNGGRKRKGKGGGPDGHPDGSWKCQFCGNVNYPSRTSCNNRGCGVPRAEAEGKGKGKGKW